MLKNTNFRSSKNVLFVQLTAFYNFYITPLLMSTWSITFLMFEVSVTIIGGILRYSYRKKNVKQPLYNILI